MPQASQEQLIQMVAALSAEQQKVVEAFIRYLRGKDVQGSTVDVRTALDEFVQQHSELLRRLAQ